MPSERDFERVVLFRGANVSRKPVGDPGEGATHALVNLTLWLQKLTKEEKVKNLCDTDMPIYSKTPYFSAALV